MLALFAGFAAAADAPPTYEEHVLPIFREKCGGCHNPDKKQGGLDLTSFGQALAGGSSGEVIAPGDADGSYLWQVVSHSS
ncbi:MAG: c-type cytochrome domain-containing protein, partial [Planctomycetia bacterium]